jgi:Zn-finger nucleic acid-binding protein
MGMMFVGTRYCPHCGASARRLTIGETTEKDCPRCDGALSTVGLVNEQVELCRDCGGVWMPLELFDRVCSDADLQNAATGMALPPRAIRSDEVRYLKCPDCSSLMGRKGYPRGLGIVTDICRRHGIWLDTDELRHIIEFIRAGGLTRARERQAEELERKRRALEVERQGLEAQSQADRRGSYGTLGGGGLGGLDGLDLLGDLFDL